MNISLPICHSVISLYSISFFFSMITNVCGMLILSQIFNTFNAAGTYYDDDDEDENSDENAFCTLDGRRRVYCKIRTSEVPAAVARYLLDFQVTGIRWLWEKYLEAGGGILADEMGLGKTLQTISLLLAIYRKSGTHADSKIIRTNRRLMTSPQMHKRVERVVPSLIVAPASVVDQWMDQLGIWGHFSVMKASQHVKKSDCIAQEIESRRTEVLVMSYDFMKLSICQLEKIQWNLVVFDEGHTMKDSKGERHKAASRLQLSRCRLMLTGTPIQNKIEELGSLLSLLTQDSKFSLHNGKFKNHFVDPIKRMMKRNADELAVELGQTRQQELQQLLDSKYLLRRTKDQELTELTALGKKDNVIFCNPSDLQKELYEHILSLPDFDNVRYCNAMCPCGSGVKRSDCCVQYQVPYKNVSSREIDERAVVWRSAHVNDEACVKCPSCICLPCIIVLHKLSQHPSLLQKKYQRRNDQDIGRSEATASQLLHRALTPDMVERMGGEFFRSNDITTWDNSGKFFVLKKLLHQFHNDQAKTLVFANSIKILDLMETFIKTQGYQYCRLDGNLNATIRQVTLSLSSSLSSSSSSSSSRLPSLSLTLSCRHYYH